MFQSLKNTKIKFILSIVIILLGITTLIVFASSNKVNELVTIEAGSKSLDVADFIIDEKYTGEFITDLSTIDLNTPGIYDLKIKIGKKDYKCCKRLGLMIIAN